VRKFDKRLKICMIVRMGRERIYRDDVLSANFSRQEIACKGGSQCCGGVAVAHPLMVTLAQTLRDRLGIPLFVNSGFRCIIHNTLVGGVKGSDHTLGGAWDLSNPDVSAKVLYLAALDVIADLGYGYVILYEAEDFIHLGIRKR